MHGSLNRLLLIFIIDDFAWLIDYSFFILLRVYYNILFWDDAHLSYLDEIERITWKEWNVWGHDGIIQIYFIFNGLRKFARCCNFSMIFIKLLKIAMKHLKRLMIEQQLAWNKNDHNKLFLDAARFAWRKLQKNNWKSANFYKKY